MCRDRKIHGKSLYFPLNFTINLKQYVNELILVKGGNLTVLNSNFYDIRSIAVISTYGGVQNKGYVFVENTTFKNRCYPSLLQFLLFWTVILRQAG